MSFLSLIIKNPFRNKSRAILAIIGIGIGIATIVALGGITDGLISSADDTLHAGGTDITVTGSESAAAQSTMFGTSSFDDTWVDVIKNQSGVTEAVGVYSGMISTQERPMISVVGISPQDLKFAELNIKEGKVFSSDNAKEVIVGKVSADNNDIKVGDTEKLGDEEYKVVGIFESGNSNQDMSTFMTLENAQELMQDEGNLTSIFVKVSSDVDADKVADEIEDKYGDNLTAITSLSDLSMAKNMIDMINGASWGISLLAIIIGGLVIINTMLMSVFERTREIGVLKAVGWSDKRILTMIIGESIVITIVAAIVGSICGVVGVELLTQVDFLGGMKPIFSIETFAEAFVIALFVGIIGGIYPAIKAIKLPPTEALRYE